jgi:hypothetical protein
MVEAGSRSSERAKTSNYADVSGEPLTLVAQPSELTQLDLAQRRPTSEEHRHTVVTILTRVANLIAVER